MVPWGINALLVLIYMGTFYLIALKRRNNSVADIAWGGGFILMALINLLLSPAIGWRQAAVTLLVLVWGSRLVLHIARRNRGKPEDFRYRKMRELWGEKAPLRSLTHVFLLQGILMLLVGLPIILINRSVPPETWLDAAGFLIAAAGLVVEIVADHQLHRFIRYHKSEDNPIMIRGLWRYSRHPNYFGEAVIWWGLFLMAVNVQAGWAAVASPILMTCLLRFVSGVPLLEKRYQTIEPYRNYSRRTSIFVPWFPKKG
jgi:steroid 5-alpha reductase family enzyme